MSWNGILEKLDRYRHELTRYEVKFVDNDEFIRILSNFQKNFGGWNNLCITGYFGQGIAKRIISVAELSERKVRMITRPLNPSQRQDRKNLDALKKMRKEGVEVRINDRIHARMTLSHHLDDTTGVLLLGTFDYNREGLSGDNINAGIFTKHPDLVKAAVHFFNSIWENDIDTIPFDEKYPD